MRRPVADKALRPPADTKAAPGLLVMRDVRCWRCDRLIGSVLAAPFKIRCLRCYAMNNSPPA